MSTNDTIIEHLKTNPSVDNVMIDTGIDTYFRSVTELDEPIEQGSTVTTLETLASFDHGLRCGDETSAVIGIECAAQVMSAFIPLHELRSMDLWSMMCDILEIEGWTGGWAFNDDDDDADGDKGQWVYEWSEEMRSAAHAAGLVVESDSDCGMTWIFQPHETIEVTNTNSVELSDDVVKRLDRFKQDHPDLVDEV